MPPKKKAKSVEEEIPSTAHRDELREAILASSNKEKEGEKSKDKEEEEQSPQELAALLRSQRDGNAQLWQEITELHEEAAALRRETITRPSTQDDSDSDSDAGEEEIESLLQLEQALQAELALLNDPGRDDELADHLLEAIRENAAIANDPETQEESHLRSLDELENTEVALRREIRQLDPANDHGGDKELWEIVTNSGAATKRAKDEPPSMRNNLLMELEQAVASVIAPTDSASGTDSSQPNQSEPTSDFLLEALKTIAARPDRGSAKNKNSTSSTPLGPLSSPPPSSVSSTPSVPTRPLVNAILAILDGTIAPSSSEDGDVQIDDIAQALGLPSRDDRDTVQTVVDLLCELGCFERVSRAAVQILI
ncbi:hypothetical protein TrST_g9903 [Triparma strigata]|uniref:Uncharacterized protein n=1 Tax=Triparma strigata TaxID=1606541 RepID=A0A9W6ZZ22_9STRA|nr:hypothetical protein TrST_g9903 [Triparma strigata]